VGFESLWLYREIELLVDTSGPMTLTLLTELPWQKMQLRYSVPFDTASSTERVPVKIRLPGDVKGKLTQLRIDGPNQARLYGVRVFAKPLGIESAWRWYVIPVVETPEGYAAAPLPILPTPEGWSAMKLPLIETPLEASWLDLPVDAIE